MTSSKLVRLIPILLIAHFVYWHLVLLLVLRQYRIPSISNPVVEVRASASGDDVTIGGARYSGIKKGDVIFRPLHFLNEKNLYKVYSMRFLSLGMPGTWEHAAVYLGEGRVMNVNPNRSPSIHEQSLQEFIQGFDERNLRFLRFTDEEAANRKVIDWIRWHQQLEIQGRTGVIKLPMLRRKVFVSDATPIGSSRFSYYVTGYNCNSLIQDAFTMAGVPGMDKLKNRLVDQVRSTLGLLAFPNRRMIQYFVQSFFISADKFEGIAEPITPSRS
jgi:hypothetical protein